jgi:hypothetical protein
VGLIIKTNKVSMYRCQLALIVAFAVVPLAGCMSMTSKPATIQQKQASLDMLIKQSDSELASGKSEQAINILNKAAKENPTSMQPWLKLSNIWFNLGNYPSAILAANEVLQRDADNQDAKSILVVAGLRVAAGAITGLVQQNTVNSSARLEAENLTKALRASLGERVLVPSTVVDNSNSIPAPASQSVASAPARRRHSATAAPSNVVSASQASQVTPAAQPVSVNSGSSDPFRSLK